MARVRHRAAPQRCFTQPAFAQVGQQQPKIAVLAPASQACREVEDSRIVAYVHRLLRKKQNKLARGGEGGGASRPSVSFRVRPRAVPALSSVCFYHVAGK